MSFTNSLFVILAVFASHLSAAPPPLLVGAGVVDISPPLGTALGGFHYSDPTRPRVTTSIHYPPEVRALVISHGETTVVIVSFDMLNVSFEMVRDVQARIGNALQIPAQNVRICATHAHSMPSDKVTLPITLAAVRLGDIALLFHPAELYTVYGLEIQRDSPFRQTLVVGYADGYVGYIPDAKAYARSEYAAAKVPRILNYPPFEPTVGRVMTSAAVELLKRVHRR